MRASEVGETVVMGPTRARASNGSAPRRTLRLAPTLPWALRARYGVAVLALQVGAAADDGSSNSSAEVSAAHPAPVSSSPENSTFTLHYVAPPACPSEAQVRAELEAAEVRFNGKAEMTISLSQTEAGLDMRVHLRVQDQTGERVLSHGDCGALVDAAVALLALAASDDGGVDALLGEPSPAPAPSPAPVEAQELAPAMVEPVAEPPPITPPSPAPQPPTRAIPPKREGRDDAGFHAPDWFIGVQGLLATSTLPTLAFGVGAYGGLEFGAFRVAAGASWWPQVKHRPAAGPGVEASQFAAHLEPCGVYRWARVQFGACATASGHWLSATALDISDPSSDRVSWWSIGPTVLIRHDIAEGFAAELAGGVAFPLRRPELRYFSLARDGDEVLFQPGFWAVDSRITLLRRF